MNDFDELWNEFNQKLFNYIESKVGSAQDAEDILQDVFIKIFNGIDKLENRQAIKSWIYRITKNTIIDYYKKKKDISVSSEKLHLIEDDIDDIHNMNDEISNCIR